MKEKFWKILPYSGYVLFLALGLLVFFLGAFSIVVIRTKDDQKIVMPDLIGKSYIEVHNELQRKQLRVRIEEIRIPEKTDGIILDQSIDPGKEVEAGSKLYLTVNVGFDRVTMPDLKGQNLTQAKALLDKVLSGDIYVSMSIGGIIYVPPFGEEPLNTVIEQIPHAGKKTHSGEKVYLLVTEAEEKQSSWNDSEKEKYLNLPGPFVTKAFQRKKIPFSYEKLEKSKTREMVGLVTSLQQKQAKISLVSSHLEASESLKSGYEYLQYEIDDTDVYSLVQIKKSEEGETTEELFSSQKLEKKEPFYFLVYRDTQAKYRLIGKQTGIAKEWSFGGKY